MLETNLSLLHQYQAEAAKTLFGCLQKQRQSGGGRRFVYQAGPPARLIDQGQSPPTNLHHQTTPQAIQTRLQPRLQSHAEGLVLVWGLGAGHLLPAIGPIGEKRPCLWLEPNVELLAELIQHVDLSAWLGNPHLILMLGEKAPHAAQALLKQHPSLWRNGACLAAGRDLLPEEQEAYQALDACLATRPSRPGAPKREPKSIGFAALKAHHELLPVLAQEAQAAGFHPRPAAIHAAWRRLVAPDSFLWETLAHGAPAHLLAFSPQVLTKPEWAALAEAGTRRLLWCFDDPARSPQLDDMVACFDRIFCFDPVISQHLRERYKQPIECVTAATTFSEPPATDRPVGLPGQLPVTFVGSTGLQRYDDSIRRAITQPGHAMNALRTWIIERTRAGNPPAYQDLIESEWLRQGFAPHQRVALLQDIATYALRAGYLNALAGLPLQIFGDAGWAEPRFAGALSRAYGGRPLDYILETPWVYAHSAINLNFFNVQCINSPTVRIFDVMACGGFLLTEHRPCLESMFSIGEELETFRTPQELRDKVQHYLQHAEARKAIARQGQERVLQEHRYRERIWRMVMSPCG